MMLEASKNIIKKLFPKPNPMVERVSRELAEALLDNQRAGNELRSQLRDGATHIAVVKTVTKKPLNKTAGL